MKHAIRGFTLIELMTAIAVLGVLFAFAIPSFRELTRSNRTTAAQNDLVTALTYTRSEAVRRGTPVSICRTPSNSTTCLTGGTSPFSWATGWIVFEDTGATAGVWDSGEEILQSSADLNTDMVLTSTRRNVQYTATGTTSAAATFTLRANGCVGQKARQVAVTIIGSLSATSTACP
jgi:type IV fimbrial biogenesis protein FimT